MAQKIHEKPGPWLFYGNHSSCCGINVMTTLPVFRYTLDRFSDVQDTEFYGSSPTFPHQQRGWHPEFFDVTRIDEAKKADINVTPFTAWSRYFTSSRGMMTLRKLAAEEDVPKGFRVIATWPTGERLVTNAAEA